MAQPMRSQVLEEAHQPHVRLDGGHLQVSPAQDEMPFGTDMEEVKHESAEPAFPMQSPAPCKRQQKQLEKQIKKEKKEKKAAFRLGLTWA